MTKILDAKAGEMIVASGMVLRLLRAENGRVKFDLIAPRGKVVWVEPRPDVEAYYLTLRTEAVS